MERKPLTEEELKRAIVKSRLRIGYDAVRPDCMVVPPEVVERMGGEEAVMAYAEFHGLPPVKFVPTWKDALNNGCSLFVGMPDEEGPDGQPTSEPA